jgi:hypothetical protein
MADVKITALGVLTAADPINDAIPIVDVSDNSMAASGTTKRISVNNILGASGTATLASATITGDLTVDTSTLKVDSTNNRVGIGTATPTAALDILGAFGTSTGAAVIRNNSAANASNISQVQFFAANSFAGSEQVASIHGSNPNAAANNGGALVFSTSLNGTGTTPTERYRIGNDGTATWSVGGSTAMTLNSTGLGVGLVPSVLSGFGTTLRQKSSTGAGGFFTENSAGTSWFGIYSGFSLADSAALIYPSGGTLRIATTTSVGAGGFDSKMTLDSTGNVGIGVTPSAFGGTFKAVQVSYAAFRGSTATTGLSFNSYFDGTDFRYIAASTKACDYFQNSGKHVWQIANTGSAGGVIAFTQAMTLDDSGNLLVGTTSLIGVERFNVTKTTVGSYLARFNNTNTTVDTYGVAITYTASTPNDASHNFLGCVDSVGSRALIYANGGLANYSANNVNLSDARTKTDIKPLASYWNKIKALELVTFKYKDQTHNDDNIGLISQQVESVAPEFVSNDGFGETPADGVPLKSIYTTDLYHASIKALQEAMARIEALEAKLA